MNLATSTENTPLTCLITSIIIIFYKSGSRKKKLRTTFSYERHSQPFCEVQCLSFKSPLSNIIPVPKTDFVQNHTMTEIIIVTQNIFHLGKRQFSEAIHLSSAFMKTYNRVQ